MKKQYEEIIGLPGPQLHRVRMPVADRAKIFAPYAALKGFEEMVEERREEVDNGAGDR